MRRRQSPGMQRIPLLAGWLFADLFLVLFVISLASLTPVHPPKKSHVPHKVAPPPSRALDRPVSFPIDVAPTMFQDPSTEQAAASLLIRKLNHALAKRGLTDRQAGVLLVFASGPQTGINLAITTAKVVISLTKSRIKEFSQVTGVGYWSGSGNNFQFEVFFFSKAAGR